MTDSNKATTLSPPETIAVPAAIPLVPTYKTLTWTLKVEGDVFKVPDIKSPAGIKVAGSFDVSMKIGKAADPCVPTAVEAPLNSVIPAGNRIVALVIKLDPATPKETRSIWIDDKKNTKVGIGRELGLDATRAAIVYFLKFPTVAVPDHLWLLSDNASDITITISVAFGPA